MDFNAAAPRAIQLTGYSVDDLVSLLRTTNLKTDINAVATVLKARKSRAAQAEAQLRAALDDALTKIQVHEDLRRASLAEAEDVARLRRTAEEEARAILMAAVSEIHEAGKKKQDEVAAHLDAVVDEIHALRKWQREDLPACMAKIVEETEAKLKASFSKIHAPPRKPQRDVVAVPGQETIGDTALAMATPSIPVAQQSKQPDVDMVSDGGPRAAAAADGSVGKADAVENRGVSPIQISRELQENMEDTVAPPGFNPTPRFSSSTQNYEKDEVPSQETHDDTAHTMATPSIPVPQRSKQPDVEMASEGGPTAADGSVGKSLKRKADAMENRGVSPIQISRELQENMEDVVVSLSRVYEKAGPYSSNPLSQPIKLSTAKVSNEVASVEGSGKTAVTLKEPAHVGGPCSSAAAQNEHAYLGGASMSLFTVPVQQVGRLVSKRGRGRGRAIAKGNKKNKQVSGGTGSLGNGRGHGLSARPVQNCSANGDQSRNGDLFLQSNASSAGQATAGTRELVLEDIITPIPFQLIIEDISAAELRELMAENMGQYVENEADFLALINNAPEGTTSDEEGDVGTSSNSRSFPWSVTNRKQ